jgi:radical SAM protein with 4Fe4S-binding SPASM domain
MRHADMEVSICTNATITTEQQIQDLADMGNVHVNVSLDGFRPESHGKFRGDRNSFAKTVETIELLSRYGLLKGLLVTPNNLADIQEYAELCGFAVRNKATYVLLNPLSKFGRGVKSTGKLSATDEVMNLIRQSTSQYADQIELVNIRFPNKDLPLAGCEAGNIIYVFTHGEVAICPYLVFAAKSPNSRHDPREFIVGNMIQDAHIADLLDNYRFHERYDLGGNKHCHSCQLKEQCGKGCPAAVISSGQRIEQVDREMCPVSSTFEEADA